MALLSYLEQDILSSRQRYIGHGVNMEGKMWSGVAKQIADRYPHLEQAYLNDVIIRNESDLGSIFLYTVQDDLIFFNLYTQVLRGANANADAVVESITRACHLVSALWLADRLSAKSLQPEFAIVKVGCGVGGLDWADIAPRLQSIETETKIVVYTGDLKKEEINEV